MEGVVEATSGYEWGLGGGARWRRTPEYYDFALCDFGLMIGAPTLNRLAKAFGISTVLSETDRLRMAA